MPIISDAQRVFTICEKQYNIPNRITFKDNCEVKFNQEQADKLYENIVNIIKILDDICPGEYWAFGGTLLGTIRWNAILPWDDDCDFGITMKGYSLLVKKLEYIHNEYKYEFIECHPGLKIYMNETCIGDIFVCDLKDKKHLVYAGPIYDGVPRFYIHDFIFNQIKFKKSDIFPLIRMPFGNTTIPCPRNYNKILHNNYNSDVLELIITPRINNSHSFISKDCFMKVYKIAKLGKDNTETNKIMSMLFGIMINTSMHNFINEKKYYNIDGINFIQLIKEQSKEEIRSQQYECLQSLVDGILQNI